MAKSGKTGSHRSSHSRVASGCAAALVTCWSLAPTNAEAQVEITPATADFTLTTNLSVALDNAYLIYGVNASGLQGPNFFSIGLIGFGPQSQTITLEEPGSFEYVFPDQLNWGLIGTYGDTGVALAGPPSFF